MKEKFETMGKEKVNELSSFSVTNREVRSNASLESMRNKADEIVEKRLNSELGVSDATQIESPESAKRYLDLAYKYMTEYRKYEMEANRLDDLIKRKREPESRKNEVSRLHEKAKRAKMEADRYNRYAQMEIKRG